MSTLDEVTSWQGQDRTLGTGLADDADQPADESGVVVVRLRRVIIVAAPPPRMQRKIERFRATPPG